MKWGIFCFTSGKTSDRVRCINKTWGKDLDNLYYFTDVDVYKDNVIKCTEDNTYESNVEKNLYAMKYAQENNFDWSFFIGDDVYIYINNLLSYIESLDSKQIKSYGEILRGTWPEDLELSYLCGGGGMLFPKVSLDKFVKYMEEPDSYRDYKYADVVIGLIMKEAGIGMVNASTFFAAGLMRTIINGNTPDYYKITKPERYISFHFINTEELFDKLWSRDEANRNNK
tara:strand:- start:3810 stop:4490 length:681 start_codon:yes stop_codon:yes gene_type:complete